MKIYNHYEARRLSIDIQKCISITNQPDCQYHIQKCIHIMNQPDCQYDTQKCTHIWKQPHCLYDTQISFKIQSTQSY